MNSATYQASDKKTGIDAAELARILKEFGQGRTMEDWNIRVNVGFRRQIQSVEFVYKEEDQ